MARRLYYALVYWVMQSRVYGEVQIYHIIKSQPLNDRDFLNGACNPKHDLDTRFASGFAKIKLSVSL